MRLSEATTATMMLFTIYENPADYPGKFVLRAWNVGSGKAVPQREAIVTDSLAEARRHVPSWCYNIGRMKNDDPVVREVWI